MYGLPEAIMFQSIKRRIRSIDGIDGDLATIDGGITWKPWAKETTLSGICNPSYGSLAPSNSYAIVGGARDTV